MKTRAMRNGLVTIVTRATWATSYRPFWVTETMPARGTWPVPTTMNHTCNTTAWLSRCLEVERYLKTVEGMLSDPERAYLFRVCKEGEFQVETRLQVHWTQGKEEKELTSVI